MASGPITSRAPKSLQLVMQPWNQNSLALLKKSYDKPRQHIKKQRQHFSDKSPYSQSYGFSSSHVWMWELDHKQGWVLKNWCFWTVVLEKTLESPLDRKEIKLVNSKGNQPWIFIWRTVLKFLYFGHLMQRANSLEKTLMLGKVKSLSHVWLFVTQCWERLKAKGEESGRGWDG